MCQFYAGARYIASAFATQRFYKTRSLVADFLLHYAQFSTKIERIAYIFRKIQPFIQAAIERGKSVLLLGARQTGKTTVLQQFNPALYLNFTQPDLRLQFERSKVLLRQMVEGLPKTKTMPLVILDEIQTLGKKLTHLFIGYKKSF